MEPVSLPGSSHAAHPETLPTTMSAAVRREYGSPDVVRVEEVGRPEPAAGQVLIGVDAAGLDRSVLHLLTGLPTLMRAAFGMRHPRDPLLGQEVAGRVLALGPGVTGLRVGDRVAGTARGSFAAYAIAHPKRLAPIPEGVSAPDAAAVGVSGVTAWEAVVERGRVAVGERVLILGASGGVGSFAVQIARQAGASVTAVCRGAKAAYVRDLGADDVVDYETTELAGFGGPFDVIIDLAGNHSLSALRRILARNGRLVLVGGEDGGRFLGGLERNLAAAMLNPFVSQSLGWFMSTTTSERVASVLALLATGEVRAPIDHTVDLAGVAGALRAMEEGTLRGKVVVVPT